MGIDKSMSVAEMMEAAKAMMNEAKAMQAREAAKFEPYIHSEAFAIVKLLSGSKTAWWSRIRTAVVALRMLQRTFPKADTKAGEERRAQAVQDLREVLNERTMQGMGGKSLSLRVLVKSPKGYLATVTISDGEDSLTILCKAEGPMVIKRDDVALSLIA